MRANNPNTKNAKVNLPSVQVKAASHTLDPRAGIDLRHPAKVYRIAVAGAGGNGSQMISCLARMDRALRSLDLGRIDVDLYDPDVISPSNIGRQLFYESEIGQNKAHALIHRANLQFCVQWQSFPEPFINQCYVSNNPHGFMEASYDFLITCVDSGQARKAIFDALTRAGKVPLYWLDLGNEGSSGQVILGQVESLISEAPRHLHRLPTVIERYPDYYDGTIPETDIPSCSLAEALVSQDLFINDHVSRWGAHLLWTLLRTGKTEVAGYLINLKDGRVNPLKVTVPDFSASNKSAGNHSSGKGGVACAA